MKNISLTVDGSNVAFDEDGTMRHIAMKVINMNEQRRWQEVLSLLYVYKYVLLEKAGRLAPEEVTMHYTVNSK